MFLCTHHLKLFKNFIYLKNEKLTGICWYALLLCASKLTSIKRRWSCKVEESCKKIHLFILKSKSAVCMLSNDNIHVVRLLLPNQQSQSFPFEKYVDTPTLICQRQSNVLPLVSGLIRSICLLCFPLLSLRAEALKIVASTTTKSVSKTACQLLKWLSALPQFCKH